MSPHSAALLAFGAILSVVGTAKFFTAREKARRARADMRAALAGLDGLGGRLQAEVRNLLRAVGVFAIFALLVGVLVYIGGRK